MPKFWAVMPIRWWAPDGPEIIQTLTNQAFEAGCRGVVVAPRNPNGPLLSTVQQKTFHEYLSGCETRGIQVILDAADVTKCNYGDPARITLKRPQWTEGLVGSVIFSAPDTRFRQFSRGLSLAHGHFYRIRININSPALFIFRQYGSDQTTLLCKRIEAGEHNIDLPMPFNSGLPETAPSESSMQIVMIFDDSNGIVTTARLYLAIPRLDQTVPATALPSVREGYELNTFVDYLPEFPHLKSDCPRWESLDVRQKIINGISYCLRTFGRKYPCVIGAMVGGNEPRGVGWQGSFQQKYTSVGQGLADILNMCAARIAKIDAMFPANRRLHCLYWGDAVWTQNAGKYGPATSPCRNGFETTKEHLLFDLPHTSILWAGDAQPAQHLEWLKQALNFCAARNIGLYAGPGSQLSKIAENEGWAYAYREMGRTPVNVYFCGWKEGYPEWSVSNITKFIQEWE